MGRSHTAHSPVRWPASSGSSHTGHSDDQERWADRRTARSPSRMVPHRGPYPECCTRTLHTHTHSRTNESRSCFCKQPKTYLFSLNCLCFNYPSYSTGGGNVHPHLLHAPWTHQSQAFPWVHLCPRPKRHLDRFSRFCRAHDRDRPTD